MRLEQYSNITKYTADEETVAVLPVPVRVLLLLVRIASGGGTRTTCAVFTGRLFSLLRGYRGCIRGYIRWRCTDFRIIKEDNILRRKEKRETESNNVRAIRNTTE